MFSRFLKGISTLFPFFYIENQEMKYFPEDIYVNDWKMIGNNINNIIKNNKTNGE